MKEVGRSEGEYGRELTIDRDLGIGPTQAARVVGDTLYTIGQGKLHIFDISNPADPKFLGKIGGLGHTRQIAVSDGIAYITSREDGVFIVDMKDSQSPDILCHYDSIEVATGIDVSGEVLFVACRHHGVELVDISNPRKPLYLSTVRTGEAQSVAVWQGYAYAGVWHTSEIVVANVRNPREPKITARCPLNGFGDGLTIRGKHLYAATGHHSPIERHLQKRARRGKNEPGYGRGHGLEIFDISNPAEPKFVSRVKNPVFYRITNDMWSVKVSGDHAFVADTHNGIFVVNIEDPDKPFFVAQRQLPYIESEKLPGFVGGLALAKDYIYVAGGWTDLHVVAAPGLAKPCVHEQDKPPVIPPSKPRHDKRFRIYRCDGQVRAVDFMGDTAIVAAGSDGIHVVQLWPEIKRLNQYDTEGFAMEVKVFGNQVYLAEERGGLSIWQESGKGALTFQGRYESGEQIVRDVVVPKPGTYALLELDMGTLDIVNVSNPADPKRVFRDPDKTEKVFHDGGNGFMNVGNGLVENRYVAVLWGLAGLRWYDLSSSTEPTFFNGDNYEYWLGTNGSVAFWDKTLLAYRGGLLLVDREEHRPLSEMEIYRVDGHTLSGELRLYGNKLYVSRRPSGDVSVIDVSDVTKPVLLEHLNVPGNPGELVSHNGILVIPNGYEGLWVDDR